VRALAVELAPVRVNAVSPGIIDTPAWDRLGDGERTAFLDRVGGGLPVGRVGRPEEVAEAMLALLVNGFANGATLPVDGGGRIA
jgi:NAD(P)-dependent dehydrogenase (short-subunit alcohol dehydrogenase family)